MEKLFLIRHGESKPGSLAGGDVQRSLTDLGIRQIEHLSQQLKSHLNVVPYVVCSHAIRAHSTAKIIAHSWEIDVEIDHNLYYGGKNTYEDAVVNHQNEQALILVGHNPDISI